MYPVSARLILRAPRLQDSDIKSYAPRNPSLLPKSPLTPDGIIKSASRCLTSAARFWVTPNMPLLIPIQIFRLQTNSGSMPSGCPSGILQQTPPYLLHTPQSFCFDGKRRPADLSSAGRRFIIGYVFSESTLLPPLPPLPDICLISFPESCLSSQS